MSVGGTGGTSGGRAPFDRAGSSGGANGVADAPARERMRVPSWRAVMGGLGLAHVPMVVGSALAWAWLLTLVFFNVNVGAPGPTQAWVLLGLVAGMFAIVAICRRGGRGPELRRPQMLLLSVGVTSLLLVAALLSVIPAVEAVLMTPPLRVVQTLLWVLVGVGGAYALRRALLSFEALAARLDTGGLLFYASCVLGGASALGLMASRMDELATVVFVLVAMPVALWLLPQGRPALPAVPWGSAGTAQAEPRSSARPVRSSLLAILLLLFAAIGFTCGFHTAVGHVLYADEGHPTVVFLALIAGELLCALVLARLAQRHYQLILQLLCAASLLALAPFLFVKAAPDSVLWHVLQAVLVMLSVSALLVTSTLFARAVALDPQRDSVRLPSEIGIAVLALSLLVGWVSGALSRGGATSGAPAFQALTTLCIALMLLCVVLLGLPLAKLREQVGAEVGPAGGAFGSEAAGAAAGSLEHPRSGGPGAYATGTGAGGAGLVRGISPAATHAGALAVEASTPGARLYPAPSPAHAPMAASAGATQGPLGEAAGTAAPASYAGHTTPAAPETSAGRPAPTAPAAPADPASRASVADPSSPAGPAFAAAPAFAGAQPPAPDGSQADLARRCDELAWRYGLSERERDLLDLLARGLNAQQIADELTVSRNTVKTHMAHIYAKAGIHTRAELSELLGVDARRARPSQTGGSPTMGQD